MTRQKVSCRVDSEYVATLKANYAYSGLDIDHELGKMDAWLSARPRRLKSRRFVVAWLNRICKKEVTDDRWGGFDKRDYREGVREDGSF